MFGHVKVICFSVGLLVGLSALNSLSFARSTHKAQPAPAVSLQSAQGSAAAGMVFRAAAGT